MFSLLDFLGEHIVVTIQLLNRRCYHVIIPLALRRIPVPKILPPLIGMGFDIDVTVLRCMYLKHVVVGGIDGTYTGEVDRLTNLPRGRGIFQSANG